MQHAHDLAALGAQTLPTRDLIGILLQRAGNDDVSAAERALSLVGSAREAALYAHPAGPRLLAAVELGRRAWMLPSPAGRRVRAPVDVAVVVAPRSADHDSDGDGVWALALDKRLTLARRPRRRGRSGSRDPASDLGRRLRPRRRRHPPGRARGADVERRGFGPRLARASRRGRCLPR